MPVCPFKPLQLRYSFLDQCHLFPPLSPETAPASLIEWHHGTFVSPCSQKGTINKKGKKVGAFLKMTDNIRSLGFTGSLCTLRSKVI